MNTEFARRVAGMIKTAEHVDLPLKTDDVRLEWPENAQPQFGYRGFNMNVFNSRFGCGVVGCIAGWCLAAAEIRKPDKGADIPVLARGLLGIGRGASGELFFPNDNPSDDNSHITPLQAAWVLEWLAEMHDSGEAVDEELVACAWRRSMEITHGNKREGEVHECA